MFLFQKTFLPRPVKAFGSKECTDTKSPDFKNPLEFSDHYNIYACMTECKFRYIRNTCGCSSIYNISKYYEKYTDISKMKKLKFLFAKVQVNIFNIFFSHNIDCGYVRPA